MKKPHNKQLDILLSEGLLEPPVGFEHRVTASIKAETEHTRAVANAQVIDAQPSAWQWLVLIVGSLLGVGQTATFAFGVWLAGTAS